MKDEIKKWWNREWGNWVETQIVKYDDGEIRYLILKRISNGGLVQLKKVTL